jgi:hypothetical protein
MKKWKNMIFFLFAFLAVGFLALPAQTKENYPPSNQIPPPHWRPCVDIAVVSFTATLIRTQLGDPAVEVPHDTIKLRAVLKNIGNMDLPPRDNQLNVWMKKNNETFYRIQVNDFPGVSGGSKEISCTDSFPHGVKTDYYIGVSLFYGECSTSVENNQASFTINEAKLHPLQPKNPFPTRQIR